MEVGESFLKTISIKVFLRSQRIVYKLAKRAEEQHKRFIFKATYLLCVLGYGAFCFILGAWPQDVPLIYCLLYIMVVPLRWVYYLSKKWHYYLLDFCYYANTFFLITILFYPKNEKLFMVCFSFAEGPLAWALVVRRCSLVFISIDKIVGVLIHLVPGIVFFTIRWWNPEPMSPQGRTAAWPEVEENAFLWTWLFAVPLAAYTMWQLLYFLIADALSWQQFLISDPEVITSYRELPKKAQKADIWWRLSSLLGDKYRPTMNILIQTIFTAATMALSVLIFLSYEMHLAFQVLMLSATVWNGGSFIWDTFLIPKQAILKEQKKKP
ncbi:glycerophosphocholine acyltransferase 1-like [Zingiber officinale]|uniref:glycerophosphocholine acyltransferase 1-like n=1 Tax=Zingiber officinale TaxID=94328 RepID=UPI001C4B8D0F|nr:glycerophosphocholine acyltransferase 1-like [Zingiber officinale]